MPASPEPFAPPASPGELDSHLPGSAAAPGKSLLVLGLGNDILRDDAVGLNLAQELRRRLVHAPKVEVTETAEMGLSLLDFIVGYQTLVLVDSVQTGKAPAGTLHEIEGCDLRVIPATSPHFLGVGEVITLGQKLGLSMPTQVRIFAIEVEDPFTLDTRMSPTIESRFPAIADRIEQVVRELAG